MRPNAGEDPTESCCLCCKVDKGTNAHDAVGMEADDVVMVGVQVCGLDEMDGEVFRHLLPDATATDEV